MVIVTFKYPLQDVNIEGGKTLVKKILVIGIILLFLGVGIQPAIATVEPEEIIDVEPKDYLFQTIIEIANNPEVKNLLEQYDNDLFKVDIDRSVYRKILVRNPRLFRSMIFTKPSLTCEYLNKTYNNGIEITNILGADTLFKIIEKVDFNNFRVIESLNGIINKDEGLSTRIAKLKETSFKLNPKTTFEDTPYVCFILMILIGAFFLPVAVLSTFIEFIGWNTIVGKILNLFQYVFYCPLMFSLFLFLWTFECFDFYPYDLNLGL